MKKTFSFVAILCMSVFLISCLPIALGAKNVSAERKREIVQGIIAHGELIDLFKRSTEIYENDKATVVSYLDISQSVRAYIEAHAHTPDEVYDLVNSSGLETTYIRTPSEFSSGSMCNRRKECDQVIVGSKYVGSYQVIHRKYYRLSIEFLNGKITTVGAYLRT